MNEKEETNQLGGDILGIRPYGEAINTGVKKSFEGIEGFLKLVCAPALEEVGLLLKDHVRHWRLKNILKILHKAKDKVEFVNGDLELKAHPRVALSIIENGSLNDNEELQELWAGLFISSCKSESQNDENLIFVDLLKQLTVIQAQIIKHSCENGEKLIKNGLITGHTFKVDCDTLFAITGVRNIGRLDRELDHLRSLNLIGAGGNGGFSFNDNPPEAEISPTGLSIHLYVKGQGYSGDPISYWKDGLIQAEDGIIY